MEPSSGVPPKVEPSQAPSKGSGIIFERAAPSMQVVVQPRPRTTPKSIEQVYANISRIEKEEVTFLDHLKSCFEFLKIYGLTGVVECFSSYPSKNLGVSVAKRREEEIKEYTQSQEATNIERKTEAEKKFPTQYLDDLFRVFTVIKNNPRFNQALRKQCETLLRAVIDMQDLHGIAPNADPEKQKKIISQIYAEYDNLKSQFPELSAVEAGVQEHSTEKYFRDLYRVCTHIEQSPHFAQSVKVRSTQLRKEAEYIQSLYTQAAQNPEKKNKILANADERLNILVREYTHLCSIKEVAEINFKVDFKKEYLTDLYNVLSSIGQVKLEGKAAGARDRFQKLREKVAYVKNLYETIANPRVSDATAEKREKILAEVDKIVLEIQDEHAELKRILPDELDKGFKELATGLQRRRPTDVNFKTDYLEYLYSDLSHQDPRINPKRLETLRKSIEDVQDLYAVANSRAGNIAADARVKMRAEGDKILRKIQGEHAGLKRFLLNELSTDLRSLGESPQLKGAAEEVRVRFQKVQEKVKEVQGLYQGLYKAASSDLTDIAESERGKRLFQADEKFREIEMEYAALTLSR